MADGVYNITLSTEDGASLSENDVMYAKNTSDVGEKNVNLNFSHKLVKVVMQIYDENGNGISGAQVKINNQQTTATLNLADGTVTATGNADQELQFASNSSITGQYQTIVMPSEAMQGRIMTILVRWTLMCSRQESGLLSPPPSTRTERFLRVSQLRFRLT